MKRIKQIKSRLREIRTKERIGMATYKEWERLEKEKDELEDELKVLIKTIK